MRRGAVSVTACSLSVLGLVGAAGCSTGRKPASTAASSAASASPSNNASGTRPNAPPRPPNGLNGSPAGVGRPVLAVKIDNTRPAHPQVGLGNADIVYVEQVEGELTRLLAVFSSSLPAVIGPTRSARESDLDLLREYGRVNFAFSGANQGVLRLVHAAPVHEISPDTVPNAFFRDPGRRSPYNLFLRPQRAMAARASATAGDIGLRFAAAVPTTGTVTHGFSVRYGPATRIALRYDPTHRTWPVSMDGRSARLPNGTQLAPANVLVQYVRVRASHFHDVLGNVTPFTQTTGTGTAVVFRDGRAISGHWSRPKFDGGTRFTDARGADIPLRPGQSWILLVPAGTRLTS